MLLDPQNSALQNAVERMKALPQRSLPTMVSSRWFMVIWEYEVNDDRYDDEPEMRPVFLVVDQEYYSMHRTHSLLDAMQKCETLNEEFIKGGSNYKPEAIKPKRRSWSPQSAVLDLADTAVAGGVSGNAGGGA